MGDLILVASKENAYLAESWEPYASGLVRVHKMACEHHQMTDPGPISVVGQLLERHASAADAALGEFSPLQSSFASLS